MALVRTAKCIALTLAAIVGVGISGCSAFDNDNDHDRDTSSRRDDRISRDRDTLDTTSVPRSANMLQEGHGELSARSPDRGTVYLYDVDDGQIVWSGRIDRGERFTVDPENDRASIDGKVVYDRNLERKHQFRIYVDPR